MEHSAAQITISQDCSWLQRKTCFCTIALYLLHLTLTHLQCRPGNWRIWCLPLMQSEMGRTQSHGGPRALSQCGCVLPIHLYPLSLPSFIRAHNGPHWWPLVAVMSLLSAHTLMPQLLAMAAVQSSGGDVGGRVLSGSSASRVDDLHVLS